MQEKVLKISACFCIALSIVVCAAFFYLPNLHSISLAFDVEDLKEMLLEGGERVGISAIDTTGEINFPQQLRIELPEGCDASEVEVRQDYVTQTVDLIIPTENPEFLYKTPMVGSSKNISDVVMDYAGGKAVIEIVLNKVFETQKTCSGKYLYLDFVSPHEIYDKIVVIDAGHGGNAPGAAKQGICEKDIDLRIVEELKEFLDANEKIGVYYTRLDDSNPSFDVRAGLANKAEADLFISIHNNSMTGTKYSQIHGTQVMYDEKKSDEESKNFARICLEEVTASCGSADKGLVKGNDIFIIRTSEVPVALIEVGFMTNPQELEKLNSKDYQKKAAKGIYEAILRAFEEGY
ncbi:MAG: N-acetylmuramoyl-L-alanine amidase [Lachnospiraceae bacterium]